METLLPLGDKGGGLMGLGGREGAADTLLAAFSHLGEV
jgi:hypothetical protein